MQPCDSNLLIFQNFTFVFFQTLLKGLFAGFYEPMSFDGLWNFFYCFQKLSVRSVYFDKYSHFFHYRPSHHPGSRFTGENGHVPDSKSSLYIMLPLYTVGIVAFLLYTFYKVLSRQPNPCLLRPTLPDKNKQGDLHYKSSRQQTTSDNSAHPFTDEEEDEENKTKKARKKRRENSEKNLEISESETETTKITEFQLQALENKLKETEAQMNALIAQMALVKAVEVKLAEREAEFDEADSEDAEDRGSDADEGGTDEELSELRLMPGGIEESEEVVKEVAGNPGIMSDKTLNRENTLTDFDANVEPEKEEKIRDTFTADDNKENWTYT